MTKAHNKKGFRRGGARRDNSRRDVNGILLLDKPVGLTSNHALQRVKRLFGARKAGHTGSLDPLASGLLPICFGEATKLSAYLLDADKQYCFVCKLGERTATGDAEGEVVETREVEPRHTDAEALARVVDRFRGEIDQLPPMYSALKHNGQRLYDLARQGIEVERQPRRITIYDLSVEADGPDRLSCRLRCSKGTYVRTLAEDIGEALGCGAHVVELRREGVAGYDIGQAVTLERLEELTGQDGPSGDTPPAPSPYGPASAQVPRTPPVSGAALDELLMPLDSALSDWPAVRLSDTLAYYLRTGSPVRVREAPACGRVRLYDSSGDGDGGPGRFVGIGEMLPDGRVAPRRLFAEPTASAGSGSESESGTAATATAGQ